MRREIFVLAFVASVAVVTVASSRERGTREVPASFNWPRWRGPSADGIADGAKLPTKWSGTENVRWSAKLPGWGTSSPVVFGDRVFVTTQTEAEGKPSLLLLCLRRRDP